VKRRVAIVAVGLIAMLSAPVGIGAASAAPVTAQAKSACIGGLQSLGLKAICLPNLF
jgi:hypothetical protein